MLHKYFSLMSCVKAGSALTHGSAACLQLVDVSVVISLNPRGGNAHLLLLRVRFLSQQVINCSLPAFMCRSAVVCLSCGDANWTVHEDIMADISFLLLGIWFFCSSRYQLIFIKHVCRQQLSRLMGQRGREARDVYFTDHSVACDTHRSASDCSCLPRVLSLRCRCLALDCIPSVRHPLRWAQFFICPLMIRDAIDREVEAVDSGESRQPWLSFFFFFFFH